MNLGRRVRWRPLAESKFDWYALAIGGAALGITALLRLLMPALEVRILASGAARLAALFCGSPVIRVEAGYALPTAGVPVVVSAACSAADFYCIVAALLGWQRGRRRFGLWLSVPAAVMAALPLTLFVNGLRIVAVAQVHAWVIPRFPPVYASILHLATGVAVFLPALIALNLLFETYGNHRHAHSLG